MPAIAAVAAGDTVGLRVLDVNPLGPVHAYVVIPAGPPVRVRGLPAQTGLLEVAVATGKAKTVLVIPAESTVQPPVPVTITSTIIPLVSVVVVYVVDIPFCTLVPLILKL